uniref:Phorbol-ester/DAG-type domain-containing protein n=1 Tax=Hyaloperonospora arabidopsidis (strain Emoy2) TaxID=559515 RepID=M4BMY5_HYAAE
MELRFRGKKSAESADAVDFWSGISAHSRTAQSLELIYLSPLAMYPCLSLLFRLCEGLTKRRVKGSKTQSLTSAAVQWDLSHVIITNEMHFLNESTGLEVPQDEAMGAFVSDRDVVRLCSTEQLHALQEKFATRDQEVDDEMMQSKAKTSMGAALIRSKLKKIGAKNPTFMKLQKTLDEHTHHHGAAKADRVDPMDQFPDVDPIFESDEIEEISAEEGKNPRTCDMCEVSWPDDVSSSMYRLKTMGIVTHQGCAQFTADVLSGHPEITSRNAFLALSKTPVSGLNKPGTFHITVHRAMELPGIQLIGTQAPYARLSLLPWKEPMQTKPVENGGRNPVWVSSHDNAMQFSHMYNSTITPIPLLDVEVYNYNYLADDQIACTLVDMSPLLRYPNIEAKRWFTMSSRSLLTHSTGKPKIMLAIKFVPTERDTNSSNAHKFRVHQLKSIGLAIPVCAVCNRSIMNALKNVWGYRCELCGIDVHKGCIMKAAVQCECVAQELLSAGREKRERRGVTFRVLNDSVLRPAGELFVNFRGLHLCTKHCRDNFHAKNIFVGDTYCRLSFDGIVHETSPVLKSADPMYMETLCFKVRHPNSVFRIDVIDFSTDQCIGQFGVSLFQLLQREADNFVRTNPILASLRDHLRYLSLNNAMNQAAINDSWAALPILTDEERCKLSSPQGSKLRPGEEIGFALVDLEYVEHKKDLLRVRANNNSYLLEREEKEFSVESLRNTVDRLGRAAKIFQGIDAEYASVISWKNKKKSAVCFLLFVYGCVVADFEYALFYVFGAVLVYMLYRLHVRLEGAYAARWIGYEEYELEQEEQQKLYRPLADLHVAVHEAHLFDETDNLLIESQARMKDFSLSKLGYYVLIKYRPNDKQHEAGDIALIPSGYDETTVAWTDVVGRSQHPVWRKNSLLSAGTVLAAKLRKTSPFRNFNVSWCHDPKTCTCGQCSAYRQSLEETVPASATVTSCGVDHHAYYFPIPQASRKNCSGRDDLVPWTSFPGLLQFDLCISSSGEAKETPDLVAATTTIPLRSLLEQDGNSIELQLPLSSIPMPKADDSFPDLVTESVGKQDGDYLVARVGFYIPTESSTSSNGKGLLNETCQRETGLVVPNAVQKKRLDGHVERNFSEFVCENMVQKEKSNIIGANLFDAFWKVKDTVKQLQTEIGRACGALACAENLLNWTHPWKTATSFAVVAAMALVFSVVRGRWAILIFGLTEFGAVFVDDAPASKRVKKILWNYLSSLPTDQDLIELYEPERAVYLERRQAQLEEDKEIAARLRYHASWIGTVSTKAESDRSTKVCRIVFR